METENWINEILNSSNGIQKVVPNDALFSIIKKKIQLENRVSAKILWLVAASIVILIAINSIIIVKSQSKTKNKLEASLSLTLDKSNQLY